MRHGKAGRKFERFSAWRKATVRDIAKATLIHQRIRTTENRAKEVRKLVDQLITLGKSGTLAARRNAFAVLCDHNLVKSLFDKIAPRFKARNGGYTRIIPLGFRRGDNAQMVFLELTEKEVVKVSKPKAKAKTVDVDKAKPAAADKEETTEKKPAPGAKPPVKKDLPAPDKSKQQGKGLAVGLQKMFRRKVGE